VVGVVGVVDYGYIPRRAEPDSFDNL